jgi:hypothetical protein
MIRFQIAAVGFHSTGSLCSIPPRIPYLIIITCMERPDIRVLGRFAVRRLVLFRHLGRRNELRGPGRLG